ncbi:hypothetical protein CLAIMM_05833 [Cladophialophora immunda]|nr:hypothetical protein CLAIMM_05833 [Cladophialophora immunda]
MQGREQAVRKRVAAGRAIAVAIKQSVIHGDARVDTKLSAEISLAEIDSSFVAIEDSAERRYEYRGKTLRLVTMLSSSEASASPFLRLEAAVAKDGQGDDHRFRSAVEGVWGKFRG